MRDSLVNAAALLLLLPSSPLAPASASTIRALHRTDSDSSSSAFVTLNVPFHDDQISGDLTLRLDVFEADDACGAATLQVNGNSLSSPVYIDPAGIHSGHGILDLDGSPGLVASWNLSCPDPAVGTQSLTFVVDGVDGADGVALPDEFRVGFTAHFRQVHPVAVVVSEGPAAALGVSQPVVVRESDQSEGSVDGGEAADDNEVLGYHHHRVVNHDRLDDTHGHHALDRALREAESLRARIGELELRLHHAELFIASKMDIAGPLPLNDCKSAACVKVSILARIKSAASGVYGTVTGRGRHENPHRYSPPSRAHPGNPYILTHGDWNNLERTEHATTECGSPPPPSDNVPPSPPVSSSHKGCFSQPLLIAVLILVPPVVAIVLGFMCCAAAVLHSRKSNGSDDPEARRAASERRRAGRRHRRAAITSVFRNIMSCCGLLDFANEPDDEEKRLRAKRRGLAIGVMIGSIDESAHESADDAADEMTDGLADESADELGSDSGAVSDSEMSTTMEQDLAQLRQTAAVMLDRIGGWRRQATETVEPQERMIPPSPTVGLPAYVRYDDTPPEYTSHDELEGTVSSDALGVPTEVPSSVVMNGFRRSHASPARAESMGSTGSMESTGSTGPAESTGDVLGYSENGK